MNTIFLAGSRSLYRLNDSIKNRLDNILSQRFRVVVGDANGADKAMQKYLADLGYEDVIVYCSGRLCRNNLGQWQTINVPVDPLTKGREFYAKKDRRMADDADYGFMLWDGKSSGTINNVLELLKRRKKALVYVAPERTFHTVTGISDARQLLTRCDSKSVASIQKKIDLNRSLRELEGSVQEALSF